MKIAQMTFNFIRQMKIVLTYTVLFQPATIQMPWEVNKADGSPDEPNDAQGDEECVRMRYGLMNDAQCTKQVSGSMRENLGMGYVCERHANLIPTEAPQITTDSNIYSTCEENEWGIEPFKVWEKRVKKEAQNWFELSSKRDKLRSVRDARLQSIARHQLRLLMLGPA